MAYKTIVTVITDFDADVAALRAGEKLARREEGHLEVICLGLDRTQPGFYFSAAEAMIIQDNLAQAQKDAEAIEERVRRELDGTDILWGLQTVTAQLASLTPFIAHAVRFADLVVLPKPYGEKRGHENEAIIEAALFNGHVPVLVMPDGQEFPDELGTVVIGWNESSEALTAVRAALPLLQAAENVSIAIVEPPAHGPDRSDPGGMLSLMLSRHGVKPEVAVLAKTLPRVSDVLLRHCDDVGAQLLVMGAYGHSRFRESILGGATRNVLENADIPVLMAH
ncbi:Universal stress protein family protein [Meinhardsimonia xiamenensis]|uniref:Universal stress protein family protein n=1 Tax=Meinhardsimonia xiamenensis TaxID=990712 RepID=A0A1G8YP58_9RHOB|nr:universal stress protein [Meinhardsimonia xiamenensis]PRX37384.1 universal stress protein family protein [Meinhardsimonia xiamenensis]SDK04642.1 Universal stress protein family protein [Meinhardsimonia xiamenensis]